MPEPSVIRYRVDAYAPAAHVFQIEMEVYAPGVDFLPLTLPAWIPGSYMIRDFARNLSRVEAYSGGNRVSLRKIDKQTWQVAPGDEAIRLKYEVYANDFSVRSAHLDGSHGFFNGTSLFLRPIGLEDRRYEVDLLRPRDASCRTWRVATTLPAIDVDADGFGQYAADSYERLIDHPVEMGNWVDVDFVVSGAKHRMVINGRCDFDSKRLANDLAQICAEHARVFGDSLPIEQYLFLTTVLGEGYGGLEHRDSCALISKRDDLPQIGMETLTEGYRRFLGLCSHEYFHLWNVKRIRPLRLQQADLSEEVHTELLWAFEGITSYYDDLALVRSRTVTDDSYLELFAQTISRVQRGSGRFKQSVAESSFDAWTKFYKQDENAPNAIVSYYAKGSLIAFGLDMALRDRSDEQIGLDDLMRELWRRFGKADVGVPENGIQLLAEELIDESMDDFFTSAVYGTDELPLGDWLASLGVGFRLRPARNPDDLGGVAESREPVAARPTLGARYKRVGDWVEVTHVFDAGAALEAGISAGDRLVALDGYQINAETLADRLAQITPGKVLSVHAFRGDELYQTELRPKPAPADTCDLWWIDAKLLTSRQQRRRESWLNKVVQGAATVASP
jgi:predicted metalloprotease with PDZ domain